MRYVKKFVSKLRKEYACMTKQSAVQKNSVPALRIYYSFSMKISRNTVVIFICFSLWNIMTPGCRLWAKPSHIGCSC